MSTMLFIDDECEKATMEVLFRRGWTVDTAANGIQALEKLRSSSHPYDVIVLDLVMPELSGEEVLEQIQDLQLRVPPIIVLSGHLNEDETRRQKCAYLGAACILKKPYNPAHLSNVATAVAAGAPQLVRTEFGAALLDYMVKRREESLRHQLGGVDEIDQRFLTASEALFVVGRRWNSWYPSIFPVIGGAYVVVGAASAAPSNPTQRELPVAVIDPGFQFMKALMELRLPWQNLDTCVITHNHPDHMGGIFEFMAARHAVGKRTRLLCSAGCTSMLGDCSGYNLEVKEIDNTLMDLIPAYMSGGQWRRVRMKGFDTAHDEIGRQNSSKGLCLVFETGQSKSSLAESAELVVVGDTEYDRSQQKDKWIPILCNANTKVVVLHIGSSQLKQGTGKHLYLPGLKNILLDMESHLHAIQYRGTLLALVSEWGLEHATKDQISKICGTSFAGFNDFSPIIETIRYLQSDLSKIHLLPADIGLIVGVESGYIYLEDGVAAPPHAIVPEPTEAGIKYRRNAAAV